MFELFSKCDIADPGTTKRYQRKIQEVAKGYILWLCEMKTDPDAGDSIMVVIEGETPLDEPDPDEIQTTNVAERYCERLIALHRFAQLFPGESDFARKIFHHLAPKAWQSIKAVQDPDASGMVADIFCFYHSDKIPSRHKFFWLDVQIMVWRAMEAVKKLCKTLDIPAQDGIPKIEETDPRSFRRNVIEKFTIEKRPSDNANGEVRRQLMATQ